MATEPYLVPQSSLCTKVLSSRSSCEKLLGSFMPCDGLDQARGTPSGDFIINLSDKDFQYKDERLALLYRLSVHPRETIRLWAEDTLKIFTRDDQRTTILEPEYLQIVFPWTHQNIHFTFTTTRALLLSRHEKITPDLAMFLVQFKHDAISAKLISYITSQISDPTAPEIPTHISSLLQTIATRHLPNARRMIARNKSLNWRVLDMLLERGLPLYSLDAIQHVDWSLYTKYAPKSQHTKLVKKLKGFASRDPSVRKTINNWVLD